MRDEGAVSAIWHAAYDLGMAAGALGTGLVVALVGSAALVLTAAVRDRRHRRPER